MLVRWSWTNSPDNIKSSQSKKLWNKSLKPTCSACTAHFLLSFFFPHCPVLSCIWPSPSIVLAPAIAQLHCSAGVSFKLVAFSPLHYGYTFTDIFLTVFCMLNIKIQSIIFICWFGDLERTPMTTFSLHSQKPSQTNPWNPPVWQAVPFFFSSLILLFCFLFDSRLFVCVCALTIAQLHFGHLI